MIKQVIVVRTKYTDENGASKKIRRGKEIAQACHASIAFLTRKIQKLIDHELANEIPDGPEAYMLGFNKALGLLAMSSQEVEWINGIFTKICLKVDSEEQLLEVHKRATEAGLQCHLITDRGLTEFKGVPTNTCLAIGPDEAERIDEITKDLELY